MTNQQDQNRAGYEDGAWYWVEKEGWIGDSVTIAPACYKAECDAWYSNIFSGISTRHLRVLERCERQAARALPVVPDEWRLVPVQPTAGMIAAACDAFNSSHSASAIYPAMLAAAPSLHK